MQDDSALLHADKAYDPVKAHDYYERHKHLKGRSPGAAVIPIGRASGHKGTTGGRPVVKTQPHPTTDQELHKAAEARVRALRAKLDHLHEVLAKLVAEAKKRSGIHTPAPQSHSPSSSSKSSSKSGSSSSSSKSKPLTGAQKAAKAKQDHQRYEKNKGPSLDKQSESLHQDIEAVQKQIREARARIKSALDEARKHSADSSHSKTAPKGR